MTVEQRIPIPAGFGDDFRDAVFSAREAKLEASQLAWVLLDACYRGKSLRLADKGERYFAAIAHVSHPHRAFKQLEDAGLIRRERRGARKLAPIVLQLPTGEAADDPSHLLPGEAADQDASAASTATSTAAWRGSTLSAFRGPEDLDDEEGASAERLHAFLRSVGLRGLTVFSSRTQNEVRIGWRSKPDGVRALKAELEAQPLHHRAGLLVELIRNGAHLEHEPVAPECPSCGVGGGRHEDGCPDDCSTPTIGGPSRARANGHDPDDPRERNRAIARAHIAALEPPPPTTHEPQPLPDSLRDF